jgi:hypothetical protein
METSIAINTVSEYIMGYVSDTLGVSESHSLVAMVTIGAVFSVVLRQKTYHSQEQL